MTSALWPARLHHLRRDSAQPERLAKFYAELLGDSIERLDECWLVHGPGRALIAGTGAAGGAPYFALQMQDASQLRTYAAELDARGVQRLPSPSPLFGEEAFAVADPEGRRLVFGLPRETARGDGLPGRLQHFVCASAQLPQLTAFYRDRIGMIESDRVLEGASDLSACFLRSDPEHHSFAAFRAPASRPDHHCYETNGWMDIRDWADRMGRLGIKLWWGPGRHGPGNNLFFMIEDPDGYKVEFSAELELMPKEMQYRTWPHEERTLNLWGSAWMRS
jgi:catechol 2,3-dioxygenase-like lactoylglutathione lyase family enzyme